MTASKSDLTDNKRSIRSSDSRVSTIVYSHRLDYNEVLGKKVDENCARMLRAFLIF